MRRLRDILMLAAVTLAVTASAPPRSTLHIVTADGPVEWWRSDRAPVHWGAPLPVVANAFDWKRLRPGLDIAQAEILVNRGLLRVRAIAIRLDPAHVELGVVVRPGANGVGAGWTLEHAPADAVFAVNAGQFHEAGPWGWVVADGRERQLPGRGPLAMAVLVDSGGALQWLDGTAVSRARTQARPRAAFQSYPLLLLADGTIPRLLGSDAVDQDHRDARLAMGRLVDGRVLFVLTRFSGAGRLLERIPAGLTTPEMAALMGALGSRPALMLDGGFSAQLMVRDSAGTVSRWPGGRRVPIALVGRAAR